MHRCIVGGKLLNLYTLGAGGLAAEEPGGQAEGGASWCGASAEEEAHRHHWFYAGPPEKHALEAPPGTGTSTPSFYLPPTWFQFAVLNSDKFSPL